MRKSLWIMLAVMVVAVSAPNAHADSVTFDLSGTFTDSPNEPLSLSGTMTIDTTNGDVTSFNPVVATLGTFSFSPLYTRPIGSTYDVTATDPQGDDLELIIPSGTLVNYAGGTFTGSVTVYPPNGQDEAYSLNSGSAVPAPEPSSVALMLLGVGLVLGLRKRNSRGHQLAT